MFSAPAVGGSGERRSEYASQSCNRREMGFVAESEEESVVRVETMCESRTSAGVVEGGEGEAPWTRKVSKLRRSWAACSGVRDKVEEVEEDGAVLVMVVEAM